MYPYWLLFAMFAGGAALGARQHAHAPRFDPWLLFGGLVTALMIGFRYHVGGDWATYIGYFRYAALADFGEIIALDDPGYQLLNWVAYRVGADIWLVNLVCGAVFAWGLLRLARSQPFPWLSMLIAVPYMTIVVAMGYSRQGIAIGLLMAGIASFQQRRSIFRYAFYVVAAALFHRTAIIGLPLVLIGGPRNWLINALIVLGGSLLLYDVFLADTFDRYVSTYVNTKMTSQGAAIRIAMSIVPALLFVIYRRRLGFTPVEAGVWRNHSYAAFALALALLFSSSSTVIDRLALYILPLQLAVLPRICGTLVSARTGKFLIILYCLLIQFTWLNYAAYSAFWLPYRLYPLGF